MNRNLGILIVIGVVIAGILAFMAMNSDTAESPVAPSGEAPAACATGGLPKCGVDGKTYDNLCLLNAAKVEFAYNGECVASEPEPTTEPEPELTTEPEPELTTEPESELTTEPEPELPVEIPAEPTPESPVDTDGDGLTDDKEIALGTDPTKPDTDGDGMSDYEEVEAETDPLTASPVDSDKDGINDDVDKCPSQPENFNGFEDADGCPDTIPKVDSDKDGINDDVDKCPSQPENFNGFEDTDGCPDTMPKPDSDKDGINDDVDKCPSQPENFNGFEDADGCPDTPPTNPDFIISVEEGSSIEGCEEFDECYFPHFIEILKGDSVSWINNDLAAHTVTEGIFGEGEPGEFDSGLFSAGTSFEFTFNNAGIYPYYCTVHPWMTGQIIVD